MDVMMISRHRQWRAWQFGVRHSGLWRNSGGASGGSSDGGDAPWWVYAVIVVAFLLGITVWPELLGVLIVLGILGWVLSIFL